MVRFPGQPEKPEAGVRFSQERLSDDELLKKRRARGDEE
jgi:hypothetical protein